MFDIIANGVNVGTLTQDELDKYLRYGIKKPTDKIYDHITGERIL